MSRRNQWILIGGLVGGAVGALLGWAYTEFSEDEGNLPALRVAAESHGLRFQASSGDLVKLGIAAIPVVRVIKNMFVPVDQKQ